jgi:hypothetical protein
VTRLAAARAVTRRLAAALSLLLGAATATAAGLAPDSPARPPARAVAASDSVRYASAVTDIHRVGLTVTNYGFFGNNFHSRAPSFEFPLGSGYEHMARAGLWVGGIAESDAGPFVGVSTGIIDNVQGSGQQGETEFTPAGNRIVEISRIRNSPVYSPDAVSDQDLIAGYSDLPARDPGGGQRERHRPLGILVRQRTLAFSLPAADAFVVAQFTIRNLGPPLTDVYVGLYAQLVSGDKNAYSIWPPSANSGPGSWYYRTYAEYDSSRRLYKERYCAAFPYPAACNAAYAPPWAGVRLLAAEPGGIPGRTVGLHWWSFDPDDATRDQDAERYAILGDATVGDPTTCVPGLQSCSPIMVLSVGPFRSIGFGDSIRVDFAFVGGEDETKLLEHADYAQFAADIDYRLPTPPPSPRVLVRPGHRRLDIYWDDSPESAPDPSSPAPGGLDFEGYRVYLGLDRQNPLRVAQFDLRDTTGFNTGLEAVTLAEPLEEGGIRYRYRHSIGGLRDGFSYYGAVTSYDQGDPSIESLESGLGQNKFLAVPNPAPAERGGVAVYPNPYRVEALWDQGRRVRDHYVWFANLPPRCRLRVYTLAGDLVYETDFDGGGYRGGARGLYEPNRDRDTPPPHLSGSSFAWDLITRHGQAAATGLYVWSVENLEDGVVSRGKLLIVKSDRDD